MVLALALTACSGDDGDRDGDDGPDRAEERTPAADAPACDYVEDGSEPAKDVTLPPDKALVTENVAAQIESNIGDLSVTLLGSTTPCTVSSFVSLAEQDYFDDTPCHRLTTSGIFVVQCGDPGGTGTGGPGYTIPDEVTPQADYSAGAIAMANTGSPNTGGSQFFIVYGDSNATLGKDYTVFGTLDPDSLALVEKAAAKGVEGGGADGPPAEAITIDEVDID